MESMSVQSSRRFAIAVKSAAAAATPLFSASSEAVRAYRTNTDLLFRSLQNSRSLTNRFAKAVSASVSYWRFLNSTFPLTGPHSRPRKEPFSLRNVIVTSFWEQNESNAVESVFFPNRTMEFTCVIGTAAFSAPPMEMQIFPFRSNR